MGWPPTPFTTIIRTTRQAAHLRAMEEHAMPYPCLRSFLQHLEQRGELRRVPSEVDTALEITALCRRSLLQGGPALLFERPRGSPIPALGNLFGSQRRILTALDLEAPEQLEELGELLAEMRAPTAFERPRELLRRAPMFRRMLNLRCIDSSDAPCQQQIWEGDEVDLARLPIQQAWPDDVGPLIPWAMVVTRGPEKPRQNIGIYRQQPIARNRLIMRWLPHRGGAQDFHSFRKLHPGERFPVSVFLGADPATLLAAVTPIPDTLSEFQFAGLLRGRPTRLVRCLGNDLQVPASAEIVLEGYIDPHETAPEGPFGDHTGYYNSVERFPVFVVERITSRESPLYHSTYLGRAPYDEASVMAMALNRVYAPLVRRQFPEVVDFHLPPEACSYRIAVVSIRKGYAGHARQLMLGIWSHLRQFTYTKFVIVTDDDIDVRDWQQVIWAVSTRMDPVRDTILIPGTPVDYLDFASPESGIGGKMGLDATNKWPGETKREWGRPIRPDPAAERRAAALWAQLDLGRSLTHTAATTETGVRTDAISADRPDRSD